MEPHSTVPRALYVFSHSHFDYSSLVFTCGLWVPRAQDNHREAIAAGCGTWSDADGSDGWFVHFYCGVGWPGSSFQRSPITEYCVEHYVAPQTDPLPGGDGFAQYISCNSDECDGAKLATGGSSPRAPVCVCWVWDDRMISHVPKSKLLADCSTDVHLPWVGSNQCNCSHGLPGSDATELPPVSLLLSTWLFCCDVDAPATGAVQLSPILLRPS